MQSVSLFSDLLGWMTRRLTELLEELRHFPWRTTAHTLRERFREDRLGMTAGSLTFTTTISLVPLFTVGLAIFSAFPTFGRMENQLHAWLVQSLVPDGIARQVSRYLLQFADKAAQMGWLGALMLLVTALALILTIDRKLNDIWRVRDMRPLAQRVLVYWGVLTLGPLMAALSLSLSNYAVAAARGWGPGWFAAVRLGLDVLALASVVVAVAALYRFVPNAQVRWSHALTGGLFVSLTLAGAKKMLAAYLAAVPSYSMVYGTFASVPILLVWLYLAWVIVLLGAVVVAYLPALLAGIARRGDTPGWPFQLALEVLAQLRQHRDTDSGGVPLQALAQRLRVDPLQLEPPLETLHSLGWVGQLKDADESWVLLVEPERVSLAPLIERLLLVNDVTTGAFWRITGCKSLVLSDALPRAIGEG